MRPFRAITIAACLTLVLSACSSGSPGVSGSNSPTSQAGSTLATASTVPEASTPTPTPVASDPVVVMLSQCGGDTQLVQFHLSSKTLSHFSQPLDCNSGPNLSRRLVSPDGLLMVFSSQSADSSSHVGWSEGVETVDVTASLETTGGALASVRQDEFPTFTWDGNFAFLDSIAKKVVFVSTATHQVIKEVDAVHVHDPFYVGPDGVITSRGGISDYANGSIIPGAAGSKLCPSWDNFVQFFPGDGTAVLRDLTVIRGNGVDTGSGCNGWDIVRQLIPKTDFSTSSSVFDPASGLVYFVGTRGREVFLFSVPLSGKGEVQKVYDLSSLASTYGFLDPVGFHP